MKLFNNLELHKMKLTFYAKNTKHIFTECDMKSQQATFSRIHFTSLEVGSLV